MVFTIFSHHQTWRYHRDIYWLVILTILKNMSSSMGRIIPYIVENKTSLKPPTTHVMWLKHATNNVINHYYHDWESFIFLPPIKMVMTGGWFVKLSSGKIYQFANWKMLVKPRSIPFWLDLPAHFGWTCPLYCRIIEGDDYPTVNTVLDNCYQLLMWRYESLLQMRILLRLFRC